MNQTQKTNRGLRYLFLDRYMDTEPELVKVNITKLQVLCSLESDISYQPLTFGIPHDAAVRIPRNATQPECLVWFDFVSLLADEPDIASRHGTATMDVWTVSHPGFYIVSFPKAPGHVCVVPYNIAWRERECMYGPQSVPGPYLPYLVPLHLVPEALQRISMIPWGFPYISPGTGVKLEKWMPSLTTKTTTQSTLQAPEPQLSTPQVLSSSSTGQKRRRDSDNDGHSVRAPPAYRESASIGFLNPRFDGPPAEQDLFSQDWVTVAGPALEQVPQNWLPSPAPPAERALRDWSAAEQSILPVIQEIARAPGDAEDASELQQGLQHSQQALGEQDVVASLQQAVAAKEPQYIGGILPDWWTTGFEGSADLALVIAEPTFDPAMPGGTTWAHSPVQDGPATTRAAAAAQPRLRTLSVKPTAGFRALAPAPTTGQVEAGSSQPSSAALLAGSWSTALGLAATATLPSPARGADIETEPAPTLQQAAAADSADSQPLLIGLHEQHPWCNHIYLPPSPIHPLLRLTTPDTFCMPILTSYIQLPDESPMPLSRLEVGHPCIHVLSYPLKPDNVYILPSRDVDTYNIRLDSLRATAKGNGGKSNLRGLNKRKTEHPWVQDVVSEYKLDPLDLRELGNILKRRFEWEMNKEKKTGKGVAVGGSHGKEVPLICTVGQVLQVQVDSLDGMSEGIGH